MRVLLAGGTGAIGREIGTLLVANGHAVRLLTRSAERAAQLTSAEVVIADACNAESLRGIADGIDVVVSALGANVTLSWKERRSYADVDVRANANLLAETVRAGVKRFIYIGVHTAPGYDDSRYVEAHEAFVRELRQAPVSSTVVRPTGVFSALTDFIGMARSGKVSVIGSGEARTNPIHPIDVAANVVECLTEGPLDVPVGGPEVLQRKDFALLAFQAVGKEPRLRHVSPKVIAFVASLLRYIHPRLSDLFEFVSRVSVNDAVAPVKGQRTLLDYYREILRRKN